MGGLWLYSGCGIYICFLSVTKSFECTTTRSAVLVSIAMLHFAKKAARPWISWGNMVWRTHIKGSFRPFIIDRNRHSFINPSGRKRPFSVRNELSIQLNITTSPFFFWDYKEQKVRVAQLYNHSFQSMNLVARHNDWRRLGRDGQQFFYFALVCFLHAEPAESFFILCAIHYVLS